MSHPIPPAPSSDRLLSAMLGTIGFCLLPIALSLNPWLLNFLWQDTLPMATGTQVLFWALHLSGTVAAGKLLWRRPKPQPTPRILGIALAGLGFSVAAFLVFLFEAFFGIQNLWTLSQPRALQAERNKAIYLPDPELEHLLQPNHAGREVFRNQIANRIIYDVEYHTDARGWRVVPGADSTPGGKHLALFGCSYTFGKGLNDDQTLAARLVPHMPDHRLYNFGVSGWGTAQVLRLLETHDLRTVVAEPAGIGVYIFFDDHMRRALGTMRRITSFGEKYPYYTLDANDRPVFRGTFDRDRPWTNALLTWLSREQFIQWSGVDMPPRYSDADYHFTVRLIDGIRREYLRQFPQGRFVTLLFPIITPEFHPPTLMGHLRDNAIDYIAFPDILDRCNGGADCTYELDGHPKPHLVNEIALRFADELRGEFTAP